MKKDNFKTEVIFRKSLDGGTIEAFFPYVINDLKGNVTVYAHIGQHSGACWEYYLKNTIPAKAKDYQSLKSELESLGYNLKIVKKRNYNRYLKEFQKIR